VQAVDQTVPVLLLDLDGVLNPFAAPSCLDGYQERVFFEGEGAERYRVAHGGWIRELAAVGDLWWATGWGENANELYLPLLGVKPLPVVRFPPVPFEPELKVPAISAVVDNRAAAWIDDNHTLAGRRWADERAAPTLRRWVLVCADWSGSWTATRAVEPLFSRVVRASDLGRIPDLEEKRGGPGVACGRRYGTLIIDSLTHRRIDCAAGPAGCHCGRLDGRMRPWYPRGAPGRVSRLRRSDLPECTRRSPGQRPVAPVARPCRRGQEAVAKPDGRQQRWGLEAGRAGEAE
jgi:hypothetical protein